MSHLLQHFSSAQAITRPTDPAIVWGDETWTYHDLEARSNQVARVLHDAGVCPGERVVLLAPRSPWIIAGILGVLKAGGIYVPLDAASPAPRLARMLDSSGCTWVLTAPGGTKALATLAGSDGMDHLQIGWIGGDAPPSDLGRVGFTLSDVDAAREDPHPDYVPPDSVAHLLFTSGSTGIPKGVMVTHASVRAFVDWATRYYDTQPGERISGHPPLHFDLSTFDMFGTFAVGATLYPVPVQFNLLPPKLAAFIRDNELTQWFSVPSVLAFLAKHDAIRQDDFPRMKRLLWCGDVLPTPVLKQWMGRLPHVTFSNLYGPTEATIASSYYTVPPAGLDDEAPVPIGVACGGEFLEVLDENFGAVPTGEIGDLYIGGAGLSPGYWNDHDKTSAAFVTPDRGPAQGRRIYRTGDLARWGEDGQLHFVGRADTQIKSRGYRIELGEIETALHRLSELRECAVVAVPSDGFEGLAICCAFVPQPGTDAVTPASVRTQLAELVPTYMLPARWLSMDVLPKNANGKIDRPAIRKTFQSGDQPQ